MTKRNGWKAAYQAQRAAAGESGFDGYRFAGNVASPMNLAAMSKVPAAATALGRIGAGVLAGGVGGALSTVNDGGNFWNEKGKQVGIGAATGGALSGVANGISRVISPNASMNPQYADELSAINTGWANFKRVQNAAAKVGADDGVFTPAQLQSAVRVMDKSKDKARFAEGNALMQDLSGAAKSQMGGKIADSGTAGRLLMGIGALNSGLLHPAIPVGLLGGAAAYTPPVQSLLRGLLSSRPESAEAIAEALRQASPFLIPGGAQVGLGLLNQ